MKNLMNYVEICKKELDAINIKYGNVTKWDVNTRAQSRWGQCKSLRNRSAFEINISSRLLADDSSDEGLKNTIIHELLHTCDGGDEHKGAWKYLANKVNNAYGYNIKRTSSSEEKGVEPVIKPYSVRCEKCGRIVSKSRITNLIRHPEEYRCGVCGGEFHEASQASIIHQLYNMGT